MSHENFERPEQQAALSLPHILNISHAYPVLKRGIGTG